MEDPRNTQLGFVQVQEKPCEVCGDLGFDDKIVTCFQCQSTCEHAYCMRVPLLDIPEIWICEECRASEDRASAKPQSSDVVLNDPVQSVGSGASRLTEDCGRIVQQEKDVGVGAGEVKYLPADEAIELSLGSKKLPNSSPCKWGSCASKWSASCSQSANMTVSTTAGLTTFSNFSLQRVETNATVTLKAHSESPGHGGGKHIMCAEQQECQIKDNNTPLTHHNNYVFKEKTMYILRPAERFETSCSNLTLNNPIKHAVKQEPVDTLMPAKRVETSNSILEKAIEHGFKDVPEDFLMPTKGTETSNSTIEKAIKDVIKKEPIKHAVKQEPVDTLMPAKRVETSNSILEKAIEHRFKDVPEEFLMPTKRTETSNSTIEKAIKDVIKKEPADALKSVETSKQAIKKDFTFAPSTSMGALPIIGSGVSIDTGITANSLKVHESNLPKPLLNKVHVASAVWSGSIVVAHPASCSDVYHGFQALFPGIVHRNAMELSAQLPGVLSFTTVPRSVIMSEVFQNEFPYVDDIALYFLPDNMERSKKQYEVLLGFIEMKDLVLRSHLNGANLLLLPSKWLHENIQGSNSFLWGVYYPTKGHLALPPLSCNAISQVQCFDGHRDVKTTSRSGQGGTA